MADKLKALPYRLRVNLRKLVGLHIKVSVIIEKGAPGLYNPEVYSISELSMGKVLTVRHHGIEKKFPL